MALGTTLRSFTPTDPQAALAAPLMVGVPSTHELLVHTHSSKETNKQRKRRGAKGKKLSPNHHGLTALASSVSNLDFLKYYRAQSRDSSAEDVRNTEKAEVEKNRINDCRSDETMYVNPNDKVARPSRAYRPLQRQSSSSVPRLDKITQTNGDSPSRAKGKVRNDRDCGGNNAVSIDYIKEVNGRCSSCRDLSRNHGSSGKTGNFGLAQMYKTQGSTNCIDCDNFLSVFPTGQAKSTQYLSLNNVNTHPLLSSKQSRLFTVRQLHVESTDDEGDEIDDDDSSGNSNIDESDSECEKGKSIELQKSGNQIFCFPKTARSTGAHSQGQCAMNSLLSTSGISSSPIVHDVFQIQGVEEQSGGLEATAASRMSANDSGRTKPDSRMSSLPWLSVHSGQYDDNVISSSEKATYSSDCPLSSPPISSNYSVNTEGSKPSKAGDKHDSFKSTIKQMVSMNGDASVDKNVEHTGNSNQETLENVPNPYPLESSTYVYNSKTSGYASTSTKETTTPSQSNVHHHHHSPRMLPGQGPKPSSSTTTLPSRFSSSPHVPSSKKKRHSLVHNAKPNKSTFTVNESAKANHLPLLEFPPKSHQIYPTNRAIPDEVQFLCETPHPAITSRKSETPVKDQEALLSGESLENKPNSLEEACSSKLQSSTNQRLGVTKQDVGAERKKRIQKLQEDLVRISKELQDLNNLDYDVSEV